MKTLLAVLIAALGLSAATTDLLRVNLATPVMVGSVEMQPGVCTVQQMSNGGSNIVLLVRCEGEQQSTVLANRMLGTADSKTGVVLNLRNGRYVLDQVWLNPEVGFQIQRVNEQ